VGTNLYERIKMESLIEFVKNWGYIAVFLGSLVEGESIVLTASSLAALGYLSIYKVMAVAFCGTLIADQCLYLVGMYQGHKIFDKFPRLRPQIDKAFSLLNKNDVIFIISCRFIYGIRVASAIVIGAAKVPPKRFITLNIISALIWTVVSCGGGYLLGEVFHTIWHNFETVQMYLILGLLVLALLVVTFIWYRNNKRKK